MDEDGLLRNERKHRVPHPQPGVVDPENRLRQSLHGDHCSEGHDDRADPGAFHEQAVDQADGARRCEARHDGNPRGKVAVIEEKHGDNRREKRRGADGQVDPADEYHHEHPDCHDGNDGDLLEDGDDVLRQDESRRGHAKQRPQGDDHEYDSEVAGDDADPFASVQKRREPVHRSRAPRELISPVHVCATPGFPPGAALPPPPRG